MTAAGQPGDNAVNGVAGRWARAARIKASTCATTPCQGCANAVDVLASPCDAIVGACGPVDGLRVFQAKGFRYTLLELFGADPQAFAPYRDGCFATLRLTSSMYHRFHAPHDCQVQHVTHHAGDTWNVNPIALKRVEKLYGKPATTRWRWCRWPPSWWPACACTGWLLGVDYRGPDELPCDARRSIQ